MCLVCFILFGMFLVFLECFWNVFSVFLVCFWNVFSVLVRISVFCYGLICFGMSEYVPMCFAMFQCVF